MTVRELRSTRSNKRAQGRAMAIKGLIYTGIKGPGGQHLPMIVMQDMTLYRKLPVYQLMKKRGIRYEVEVAEEDRDSDYLTLIGMDRYKPPLDN